MAKNEAAKRDTKVYSVIVKTETENMPIINKLMDVFEKRFKQELGEHGSVTVIEDVPVEKL